MAECVKPLITYNSNVIIFGKVGVAAPIANALFTEKMFNEADSQEFSDLQAENLCRMKMIDSVQYKVQLIDTYAQGKPVVSATADVKRILNICAQGLEEGINLAIFALSYDGIDEGEVEALTILLDNMDQSVVKEMAVLVLSVHRNFKKEKLTELEHRLVKSEKMGALAAILHKRLVISFPKTVDPELDMEEDHHKTQAAESHSTQKLKDILHSSREMWLASELFKIKKVSIVKQPSTGSPKTSGQIRKGTMQGAQSPTVTAASRWTYIKKSNLYNQMFPGSKQLEDS